MKWQQGSKKRKHWETDSNVDGRDRVASNQVAVGSPMSFDLYPSLRTLPMRELHVLMDTCPGLPETPGRLINLAFSEGFSTRDGMTVEGDLKARVVTPR